MRTRCLAALLATPLVWAGEVRPDMKAILEKLDRLEEQNRQLMAEIRTLREQVSSSVAAPADSGSQPANPTPAVSPAANTAPAGVSPEERLAVVEKRVDELDQSKAGTQQRLPLTLTGTVLFNAFRNGRDSGGQMNPTTVPLVATGASGGGTLRQTVLGVRFDGPEIFGGGKVIGTLYLDLFAGSGTSLLQEPRLRVATLDAAWKNTTVTVGQDKPIIAPREPESLAQVGVSPLTGAGNLWLWISQARVEQRFALGDQSGLRAQVGVVQTSESGTGVPSAYSSTLAPARPGIEGRFEFWTQRGGRRFEFAPSFHLSDTHVIGHTAPSQIFSADWLLRPFERVDFTGQVFQGENVGVIGGLRQGVTIVWDRPRSVRAQGGWAQVTLRMTPRITFHIYGGEEQDRRSDLNSGAIARNLAYAANIMYRLGPNVLASFEASQVRTTYVNLGTRLNPHYDLALAYLF